MFNPGNFFPFFGGNQKTLEMKSPNGSVYRFSTNTMDDKTFAEFKERLTAATNENNQELFDQIWAEFTTKSEEVTNPFEHEMKKIQGEIEKLFKDRRPLFGGGGFGPFSAQNPLFGNKGLTAEDIDRQIEALQEMKKELQSKVNKEEATKRMEELKQKLDEKLLVLSEVTNPDEKQALTDELAGIYKEMKELEKKLNE